ncbi:hypothetical protein D3C78_1404780 [compost metagenome]
MRSNDAGLAAVTSRRLVSSSAMRSWRRAVSRCSAGARAVRFSAYSAVVRMRLSRSGRKPGAMPGMSKKFSVLNT